MTKLPTIPLPKPAAYAILATGMLLITLAWLAFTQTLPWYTETDWTPIRQGIVDIYRGENPYDSAGGFFNPPWVALLLGPLAVLPERFSAPLNTMIGLFVLGFVALRLKARPLIALVFLFSAPVVVSLAFSNIDWVPALGLVLPPQIGLFFLLIKPQIGIGVAVYWLWEAYQAGGVLRAVKVFAPVTIAFLLSFAIYGLYPLQASRLTDIWWNTSMWPASIPLGLALLVYALRTRRFGFAILAGPLLSQYMSFNSWIFVLLGLLPESWMTIAGFIGYWVFYTQRPTPP